MENHAVFVINNESKVIPLKPMRYKSGNRGLWAVSALKCEKETHHIFIKTVVIRKKSRKIKKGR
ncbi:hypothetical protein HYT92_01600 [Candidatus Pacearchaeota archaeon]|nr:hypothetical protein [Candidatus Pacearchaeota archaeon]